MLHLKIILLFYFVQVAPPFNFSTVEDITRECPDINFAEINHVGDLDDFAGVNTVEKIEDVVKVDNFNDVNFEVSDVIDVHDFGRVNDLSIRRWSSSKEKLSVGCRLICGDNSQRTFYLWACFWRPTKSHCHNVTRAIMRNAETNDPAEPYLMNVSSRPRFAIIFPSLSDHPQGISDFQDGFLLDFPNLFAFVLQSNPFKKIKAKMFEGVERLGFLQITYCSSFSEIEDGAFENMISLQALIMTNNALTKIKATTFQNFDLFSLTFLNLYNNSIVDIHEDAFINLSNLNQLILGRNQITALHSDTFKKLAKLKLLRLYDNEIHSLPSEIFKNLINLEDIRLDHNPLSHIHRGMFNYSSSLHKIYLGCCSLYKLYNPNFSCKKSNLTIEKGGLSTKSFIRKINIYGCLDELKPSAFEGVYARDFWLHRNDQETKIQRDVFKGMRKIFSLRICGNGIKTIENNSFQDVAFTKLIELDLSFNQLRTFPNGTLSKMTQLKNLSLSNNFISTISQHTFAGLISLVDLSLKANQISQIQGNAFSSLVVLTYLHLGHNQINNLSLISFDGLQSLKYLDLSSNKLKIISYCDFDYLSSFLYTFPKTILLQQNQIRKLEGFKLGINTDVLDLSKNDISDLEGSFKSINRISISKLILSENRIRRISSTDMKLIFGMKELFLDKNQIKIVTFINSLQMIPELLNISHNNITEVSSDVRKSLQMIDHLDMAQNPWKCGCNETDRNLMQFLLNHSIISCCPNLCQCSEYAHSSVFIDCNSRNQNSLPSCLPYEKVTLDYSNNIIRNVSFTKDQENMTFLYVHQNLITSINGSSLNNLKKLAVLDLKSNHLHTLPEQMSQLSSTKIYLEGNKFVCDDCSLVNILQTVTQSVPQNITCINNQNFLKESFICLVEFTIAPYSFVSFASIILIILVYAMVKLLYMKNLRKRYEQKTVILSSKELKMAFKQECALLRRIDHQNILKMYTNLTTWVPFVKNIGHLFMERAEYSLSEVIYQTVIPAFPLNVHSLSVNLLSAIDYLHSRDHPISHGQLGTNTIYLLQDTASETLILKIGDLSQAKTFVRLNSADESTPLASSCDDQTSYIHADLQAVAKIIFALLTKKERDDIVKREEIMELSEIEFGILILALQEGMTASEALQAAPYHSAEQKKSILGEVNAYLKRIKNEKKSVGTLLEAEENACLVIGKNGAWNKHFELVVMEEFALAFDGYNITSFVDLLRLIRNMLEHGHERPKSMEAAFQTKTPTPEKMFLEFSKKFPFFYLHSLLCYYNIFKGRSHLVSEIFVSTYRSFEKALCEDLLVRGSLLHLQEKSYVTIHFKSVSDNVEVILKQDHTRSCIGINAAFPEIFEKITELWHDVSVAEIIFKHRDEFIQNPYTNTSPPTPDYAVTSKIFVPEGSTIEVLKPELLVQLPDKVISMVFKPLDNVKAIKGLVMKNLTPALRKKVKPNTISIAVNDIPLKDKDKLVDLDFINVTVMVKYPNVEI